MRLGGLGRFDRLCPTPSLTSSRSAVETETKDFPRTIFKQHSLTKNENYTFVQPTTVDLILPRIALVVVSLALMALTTSWCLFFSAQNNAVLP